MYKLQLEDGTIVDNLEMNGNNYIPQSPIDVNVFNDVELNEINVIGSDGNVEELHNCKIVFAEVSGKQSFIITTKTKEEIENEVLKKRLADLTEIVMLGGV